MMLTFRKILDLIDRKAYLDCLGNQYEYDGVRKGKYTFKPVKGDGNNIKATLTDLLTISHFDIAHKCQKENDNGR